MTWRISDAARSAECDALVDLLDAGGANATLKVYTGAAPAGPATGASGTLLLAFTLARPAFGSAAAGVATLDVSSPLTATGLANGTAGWFRIANSAGTAIMDGTVGVEATFSTTSVTIGLSIQLTSGTVTVPAS